MSCLPSKTEVGASTQRQSLKGSQKIVTGSGQLRIITSHTFPLSVHPYPKYCLLSHNCNTYSDCKVTLIHKSFAQDLFSYPYMYTYPYIGFALITGSY